MEQIDDHYDAIVVGGRIAGASTAMLLARLGHRVLLLERARPGTDTLSTHALMRAGVVQLHRWGLLARLRAAGTPPIKKTTIQYGDNPIHIPIKAAGGVDALYAPRRTVLDRLVVEAAEEAGAEVRFGVRVADLHRDDRGRVLGVRGSDELGRALSVRAPLTIGADGLRSLVARRTGARVYKRGRFSGAMVYGYFEGIVTDGYEWYFRPGLSGGLIPTNGRLTCAWAGAPTARFRSDLFRAGLPAPEAVLSALDPEAGRRVLSARRVGSVRGFPGVRGFLREAWGPGWVLVGDAGFFKDPLSSHGISDALRDAELLAGRVHEILEGRPEREALSSFQTERDRLSTPLFDITDAIASYRWDLDGIRELQLRMSVAMREEVETLVSLEAPAAPVAG